MRRVGPCSGSVSTADHDGSTVTLFSRVGQIYQIDHDLDDLDPKLPAMVHCAVSV